jgi:hypothetical protein
MFSAFFDHSWSTQIDQNARNKWVKIFAELVLVPFDKFSERLLNNPRQMVRCWCMTAGITSLAWRFKQML